MLPTLLRSLLPPASKRGSADNPCIDCSSLHLLVDPAQVMVFSQDVSTWGYGAPFFNSVSGNSFSNSSLVQSLPGLPLMAEPVLDLGEVGGMLPLGVGQLGLWQSCGVWLLLSGFSIKGCVWVRFPLLLCPTRPVVSRKGCNLWCCWVPPQASPDVPGTCSDSGQ